MCPDTCENVTRYTHTCIHAGNCIVAGTDRSLDQLASCTAAYSCSASFKLLGLAPRYCFSCNLISRALDYFDTGTYNRDLTISINAIPTYITTLLPLSVQIKRLCIATQASYLILNNKIILSVQRWWYNNTYTMHHMYTPQYVYIHCSMYSYHSYTVSKRRIQYSNTCSKHILAHTNELICHSTNTACNTYYTHMVHHKTLVPTHVNTLHPKLTCLITIVPTMLLLSTLVLSL